MASRPNLNNFPWYALFIAIYAPLALLAENVGEVGLLAANRAVVVMALGELLMMFFLAKFFADWQKAGFVAVFLTILLFSYGHVHSLLEKVTILDLIIGRHRYLLFLWIILTVSVFYLAGRIKRFSIFEEMIKPISIVLLVFMASRLAVYYFAEFRAAYMLGADKTPGQIQADISGETPPDVYYIILDAYGGSEILQNDFGIDNAEFLTSLRSLGFVVVDCGQSNYAHTHLSLASSLNYDYLENLGDGFTPGNTSWAGLTNLIHDSRVRNFFEGRGYQIVAFETGYAWTEWQNVDLFIENQDGFLSRRLTPFEVLFLHTTIGVLFVDFGLIPEPQQAIQHHEMTSNNLDALKGLAGEGGPNFVFAHLIIPHHPFVFNSDGSYRRDSSLSPAFENYTDEEYYNGYRQQVMFINDRILEVVKTILSESERLPIIIIQGDHGPSHAGERARVSILNAYFLPDDYVSRIYPGITPVNTFRVILNAYFDQELRTLPNIAYFSRNADPYSYTVIPKECTP